MAEIINLSATQLASAIRAKKLSSVEVVEAFASVFSTCAML